MARTSLLNALRSGGIALALMMSAAPAVAVAPDEVRATWVGGPTLVFRFGPITLVTDPVLGEGANAFRMFDPNSGTEDAAHARLAPLPGVRLDDADLVLLSHDHADHLDEAALARLDGRALFVVPASQAEALRRRRTGDVLGLPWNASHRISRDGFTVTVTAIAAQHSPRPDVSARLGEVNGYWLEFRHRSFRRTVYWTGDSFPVPAELGRALRHPDLLVPHLGGVGEGGPFGQVSMRASDAVTFARIVEPRAVLPIHHSTFSLYREPIERFVEAARGQKWELELLDEGEELVLP